MFVDGDLNLSFVPMRQLSLLQPVVPICTKWTKSVIQMQYVLIDIAEILLQYNSFNLILMYHFDSLDATTQIVPMPPYFPWHDTPGKSPEVYKNRLYQIKRVFRITFQAY